MPVCMLSVGRRSLAIARVIRAQQAAASAQQLAEAAAAPMSLVGDWNGRYHEDQPDRVPGQEPNDYTGLPLNDAARLYADSFDVERTTLLEHICAPYALPYMFHGPLQFRVWETHDPDTQELVAINMFLGHLPAEADDLDGRPSASARVRAAHLDGILDRRVQRRHR